ncbi:DUF3024 domain-containing protein [Bradyrhizobium roseum]|uniref:DUF3024 domain-containing protein n=1 Tax=Bradyrhizobium roseum TaxID=3056648 RepID=UPI002621446D|nr:hypothetical protein [Bradyrhizobium roseus]WKA28560.1 hypothetical protein QUH67_34440 [Bradyrhizobium roseus]
MLSATLSQSVVRPFAHPNDLDRKRIERALISRKRYRYVKPSVVTTISGYRIESPCCSRNIDRDGGIVDVALLLHDADDGRWQLFRKDHKKDVWQLDSTHDRLPTALERLNADPDRMFWQ